jgi:hypothetical protein
VALGNIHDMNEIANCRTIWCVIVHSIDVDCFVVTASREGNRKEIGRWQSRIFSNRARRMSADWIEVAKNTGTEIRLRLR